ncbi:TetR family transcriptional regulator [Yinghuangia aomiensis]|uniref:TetR family transcriptional regulator n=1 Tax=Yinghuangia aomiensis TaxID=676205 RepID=A0ABP9I4P9_9ACTN
MTRSVAAAATPAGHATRLLLLSTAERLFAEHGIDGVSLRSVSAAARQRNTSATHYYFESKAALIAAIVELRMGPIDEHRRRRVDAIRVGRAPDDVRGWVEALVWPMAEPLADSTEPGWYLPFLAEAMGRHRPSLQGPFEGPHAVGLHGTFAGLRRHLAHLPASVTERRFLLAVDLVVRALADGHRKSRDGVWTEDDFRLLVTDLVDAAAGLLTAPASFPSAEPAARPEVCRPRPGTAPV